MRASACMCLSVRACVRVRACVCERVSESERESECICVNVPLCFFVFCFLLDISSSFAN